MHTVNTDTIVSHKQNRVSSQYKPRAIEARKDQAITAIKKYLYNMEKRYTGSPYQVQAHQSTR